MGTHWSPRALVAPGELGLEQRLGADRAVVLGTPVGPRLVADVVSTGQGHARHMRVACTPAPMGPGPAWGAPRCWWGPMGAAGSSDAGIGHGVEQRSQGAQRQLLWPLVMTVSLTGI